MTELSKAFPREVPIIDEMIRNTKKNTAKIKDIECQLAALIRYQKKCATALTKLVEELKECS